MLHYFIKNILLILLSIYTIYRISNLILLQNVTLFEYSHLYSNIISFLLGIFYIEHISDFNYKLPSTTAVTDISRVLALSGLILIMLYFVVIIFFSNSIIIYCSDGQGEKFTNYQVNENIQRNRPASPTFSLNADPGDDVPQPNVQKNMNIQENVDGSQMRSCQVNKNVQVNSNTTPRSHLGEISLDSIKKIKYPIIELPHIQNFIDKYGSIPELNNQLDYDSDATVKGELLPGNERRGLIKKPSQVDILVERKLEEVKHTHSFWTVFNYCSRLVNKSVITLHEYNKQILSLIKITEQEAPSNLVSPNYPLNPLSLSVDKAREAGLGDQARLPDCLLFKPIYLNGKYSLGFNIDSKYFHFESKSSHNTNSFYNELVNKVDPLYKAYIRHESTISDLKYQNRDLSFLNSFIKQYRFILHNLNLNETLWHMDENFVRYNPLFYVSPTDTYLDLERIIKLDYFFGETIIKDTGLYFSYYLEKMEAIKLERFLGDIDLAKSIFTQIQNQKLDSLYYYDYLKGFVLKFVDGNNSIEEAYIPANSLNQLLDRIKYFKQVSCQELVPFRLDNSDYLKTIIKFSELGDLPDPLSTNRQLLESKLNNI